MTNICVLCGAAGHDSAHCKWRLAEFYMERMKNALSGPSVTIPQHIKTREQIRAFIEGSAAAFAAVEESNGTAA